MTGRLLGLEWLEPRRLLSLWRYSGPQKVDHSGYLHLLETVATLPGDLGLIPIAEALKSATSRTGGKSNVIVRGPEPCSPGISRARSRIGPGYLATVSFVKAFPLSAPVNPGPMDLARGPVIE